MNVIFNHEVHSVCIDFSYQTRRFDLNFSCSDSQIVVCDKCIARNIKRYSAISCITCRIPSRLICMRKFRWVECSYGWPFGLTICRIIFVEFYIDYTILRVAFCIIERNINTISKAVDRSYLRVVANWLYFKIEWINCHLIQHLSGQCHLTRPNFQLIWFANCL